jgi:hypothetical protein
MQYEVKWVGLDEEYNSWRTLEEITQMGEHPLVLDFLFLQELLLPLAA